MASGYLPLKLLNKYDGFYTKTIKDDNGFSDIIILVSSKWYRKDYKIRIKRYPKASKSEGYTTWMRNESFDVLENQCVDFFKKRYDKDLKKINNNKSKYSNTKGKKVVKLFDD